ncbi:MAG: GNAT family N-acetyltransferase [Ilumatobacteraceae bacterium]
MAVTAHSSEPAMGAPPPPNVAIRTLHDAADMVEVVEVFKRVWGSKTELVRLEMLMAISHSGGYVTGVFDTSGPEDVILGASVALLARYRDQPAVHSHVTGILPDSQHSGIGRAVKQHQAAWAADRGLDWIVWTFDPLVRRNAWFNIAVLGVEVHGYLESFYGEMTDAINVGDQSDRLFVAWHVPSSGSGVLHDGSDIAGADLIATPDDIVALRGTDPAAVARWRRETRTALTAALAAGRKIVGFTPDGNYVVEAA